MIKLGKLSISYERGRQALLFLFCLFLAFIIWSIHKLSGEYSTYLNYKVCVTTDFQGKNANALSNNLLTLRGRSSGFYILQQRYLKGGKILYIQVERRMLRRIPENTEEFYLLSTNIKDKLSEKLGKNLEIEAFTVDTLFFNFPRTN